MQYLTWSSLTRLAAGLCLFAAVGDLPYGYYIFLRWLVTPISLWLLYLTFKLHDRLPNSGIPAYLIITTATCAFNPIIPIEADKTFWILLDLAYGAYVIGSIFFIGEKINYSARERKRYSRLARRSRRLNDENYRKESHKQKKVKLKDTMHTWTLRCPICSFTWHESARSGKALYELVYGKYRLPEDIGSFTCPCPAGDRHTFHHGTLIVEKVDDERLDVTLSWAAGL